MVREETYSEITKDIKILEKETAKLMAEIFET